MDTRELRQEIRLIVITNPVEPLIHGYRLIIFNDLLSEGEHTSMPLRQYESWITIQGMNLDSGLMQPGKEWSQPGWIPLNLPFFLFLLCLIRNLQKKILDALRLAKCQ